MHVHVKEISTHLELNSINNLSVFSRPEFKTKKPNQKISQAIIFTTYLNI